jgi:hypothetical protein
VFVVLIIYQNISNILIIIGGVYVVIQTIICFMIVIKIIYMTHCKQTKISNVIIPDTPLLIKNHGHQDRLDQLLKPHEHRYYGRRASI